MIFKLLAICFLLIANLQANDSTEIMFEAGPTYVGTTKYNLPQFYLDQFEVTNAEYEEFIGKADVIKPLSLK